MGALILRAELENGDVYDDPSEDALFEILGDIEAGEALWVIVERLGDPSRQTYAQALRDKDGSYGVERRLGTPESHENRTGRGHARRPPAAHSKGVRALARW